MRFMDKTDSDLEDYWKTYGGLTEAQGWIRIHPNMKNNIRVLIQWVKD